MNRLFLVVLTFFAVAVAVMGSQDYRPKSGESVLKVVIENRGTFFILLHTKEAPKTTARIVELVQQRFYDKQRFFKVTKTPRPFLIQAGDPESKRDGVDLSKLGSGGTGVKIPYEESGFPNDKGAVGLAAMPGDKNSGDCQFYVALGRYQFLDGAYTVFGQIIQGMDVVQRVELGDRIQSVSLIRG